MSFRPSSAASAAERLTWRVVTDAVERNEGLAWRPVAGPRAANSSAKYGGGTESTEGERAGDAMGEKEKYEHSPGDVSGGEVRDGSECVGRCVYVFELDVDENGGGEAIDESVRCEGRDRRVPAGGSGRHVEGAGFGGRRRASREERRSVGDSGTVWRDELELEKRSENENGMCDCL